MVPISTEKFIEMFLKNNKGENRKQLTENLIESVKAKQEGAKCIQCNNSIWAIGTAMTGTNMCFTCTTGEADDSEDYEIDTVCYL